MSNKILDAVLRSISAREKAEALESLNRDGAMTFGGIPVQVDDSLPPDQGYAIPGGSLGDGYIAADKISADTIFAEPSGALTVTPSNWWSGAYTPTFTSSLAAVNQNINLEELAQISAKINANLEAQRKAALDKLTAELLRPAPPPKPGADLDEDLVGKLIAKFQRERKAAEAPELAPAPAPKRPASYRPVILDEDALV